MSYTVAGSSLIMVINREEPCLIFLQRRRGEMKEEGGQEIREGADVTGKHKKVNEKRG